MMRTKFFLYDVGSHCYGKSGNTFCTRKRKELNLKEGSLIKSRCWKYSAIKL